MKFEKVYNDKDGNDKQRAILTLKAHLVSKLSWTNKKTMGHIAHLAIYFN